MAQYNPTATQIDQEGTLKEQIALYLCWCAGVAASDKANKTGLFTSNAVLTRRNMIVTTIYNRMTREQPHYPALIVLANDYQKAINKGLVFTSSLYRPEQVERLKTHPKNSFQKTLYFYKKNRKKTRHKTWIVFRQKPVKKRMQAQAKK